MGSNQGRYKREENKPYTPPSIGELTQNVRGEITRESEDRELFPALHPSDVPVRPAENFDERVEAHADARQLARVQNDFYAELNLCRFPFASLWDKDTGRTDAEAQIVVQHTLWGQGEEFRWRVTPDTKHGLPGPFDRKVFRAIEKILYERTLAKGLKLSNPQEMPLCLILQTLRMGDGGKQIFYVTQALQRLKSATIDCFGIDHQRSSARPRSKQRPARGLLWNPISEIAWAGTFDTKTGRRFNATMIWMSDFYIASFNNGNIRPIDWDLWLSLKRPIAQRLYEILEIRFFGLRDSPYASFGYRELCELLPLTPQRYKSQAMQILDRGHDKLKQVVVERPTGKKEPMALLRKVEWIWDGDDAVLRYYPDERYLESLKQKKSHLAQLNPQLDTQAFELAREMDDTKSTDFYRMLFARVDLEVIRIARTEALMAKREGRVRKRVAAYFVSALTGELKKRGQPAPF